MKQRRTREMANGRPNGNGPGIGASTTISIGTAAVMLIAIIGAAVSFSWWTSNLAAKVDQLSEVGREVKGDLNNVKVTIDNLKTSGFEIKSDINNVKNDVGSIKFDLNQVKTSVNQISSEATRRK